MLKKTYDLEYKIHKTPVLYWISILGIFLGSSDLDSGKTEV